MVKDIHTLDWGDLFTLLLQFFVASIFLSISAYIVSYSITRGIINGRKE